MFKHCNINYILNNYLKDKKIRAFIPYNKPTFDINDKNAFSVCYHHDVNMHNMIYSEIEEGYLMRPNKIITNKLDDLYHEYLLPCSDEMIN